MGAKIEIRPGVLTRMREINLRITIEFDGERRLPPQPVAPWIHWTPSGIAGFVTRIICLDGDEEVGWWTAIFAGPAPSPYIRAQDDIHLDMQSMDDVIPRP